MIGILACPGGRHFAKSVTHHLHGITRRKIRKETAITEKKYKLPQEHPIPNADMPTDILPSRLEKRSKTRQVELDDFRIPTRFTRFANGELKAEILTTVRDTDVYIVQDVENHYPVFIDSEQQQIVQTINDHIFSLFVTVDAAFQAGANRVTVVLPTYPYSRQHKKKGREGLSASRIGQILEQFGVTRIITLDIHSKGIENSFHTLRLENLHASYQIIKVLSTVIDLTDEDLVIVSPDPGAVERNNFYSISLNKPLGMLYKERDYSKVTVHAEDSNITKMRLLGNVEGKTVFMSDDMVGTGGTMLEAIKLLNEKGARRIICAASLPLFNCSAIDVFDETYRQGLFYRFIGTNAVYHSEYLLAREWYLTADVTGLFAKSISRLNHNQSLSSLLDNRKIIEDLLRNNY